jgi:serine phosphatase RsbU (regulator of sigma subunit)
MKLFYIILCLASSLFCWSQNIDSLYKTYKSQSNLKEKTTTLLHYGDEILQYDIDSAFKCAAICLNNGIKLKDTSIIGQANILFGYAHEAKGNYKEALQKFLIATNLFKKTNLKNRLAQCYTAMGIVYWYQGFTDQAIYYYKKNIILCTETKDEKGLASSYGNLAIIFDEKKDFDSSLIYYNKALTVFEKLNNYNETAACLDNMSTVYKQKKEYATAVSYNLKGYKIRESILDTLGMCASMENLGSIFIALKKYDEAIEISKRVIQIALRLGSKEDLKFSYINLKEAYEAKKDYLSANIVLNQLMEIKDSLRNLDNTNQIAELETKFKTKEKDIEISEIKLIQQLKEKESQDQLKRKNYLIIILITIGVLILSIAFLVFKRYKEKQEIADAINKKNKAIESQKVLIDKAYQELTEKTKDITDSIKYAQKIQQAVLPSDKFITSELAKTNTQHFILFKPKDIVSGDFYWFYKNETSLFYVTADSTGHGVPGGFMSMLGINLLNEIVIEKGITQPGEILNKLRLAIISSLKTDEGYSKDGMDAVVCKIDFETHVLEYATANNPIYIIRKNELTILAAQKMPVGYSDSITPFSTNQFILNTNDCIYTITDGFADQFGGEKGKKFKYKQLKELLITINEEPLVKQSEILTQAFENWKGNLEQVDDVCVIGIKI